MLVWHSIYVFLVKFLVCWDLWFSDVGGPFPKRRLGASHWNSMRHHDNPIFVVGQVVGAECWAYCLQNYVGDAKRCLRFCWVSKWKTWGPRPRSSYSPGKFTFWRNKVMKVWFRWFFPFCNFFGVMLRFQPLFNPKKKIQRWERCCWFFFTQTLKAMMVLGPFTLDQNPWRNLKDVANGRP